MKVFVIDVGVCNGCYACQFACKDEHVGNDWAPIAKSQPDTGQFWMRVDEHIRGAVPQVKMHYVPNPCMHCGDAPCMDSCPVEGAIYRRDDGLVIIDAVKCTGCRECVDRCPYGAIYFNEDLNLAQKCTGCAHLLDGGEWKTTRCADACPTEAIKFGEESEFKAEIAKAEILKPELGTRPRVHYLNIPKKFVAGTVYDPVEKEVIVGATCTLTGPAAAGKTLAVTTDAFGDFWFHGLADGPCALTIDAEGFATKNFADLSTAEKDVSLGDIPLAK
jgi:tetrathionate reductase subunit B